MTPEDRVRYFVQVGDEVTETVLRVADLPPLAARTMAEDPQPFEGFRYWRIPKAELWFWLRPVLPVDDPMAG